MDKSEFSLIPGNYAPRQTLRLLLRVTTCVIPNEPIYPAKRRYTSKPLNFTTNECTLLNVCESIFRADGDQVVAVEEYQFFEHAGS